jgi:hypothetical protein
MVPEQVWDWHFCSYQCVFFIFCLFFVSPSSVLSVASWGSVSLAVSSSSWEWRFLYSYERYSFRIQVYMSVNKSTWELTHVICFATLHTSLDWDAGWQRRRIPAGWGIFQNKRSVLSSSMLWLFLCQISFHLKMHWLIYSVQDVASKCSVVNGNVCWVPLSLSKSKQVIISAPDKKQVFEPWLHIWVFCEQI